MNTSFGCSAFIFFSSLCSSEPKATAEARGPPSPPTCEPRAPPARGEGSREARRPRAQPAPTTAGTGAPRGCPSAAPSRRYRARLGSPPSARGDRTEPPPPPGPLRVAPHAAEGSPGSRSQPGRCHGPQQHRGARAGERRRREGGKKRPHRTHRPRGPARPGKGRPGRPPPALRAA